LYIELFFRYFLPGLILPKMDRSIFPNALTLLNLIAGCVAVLVLLTGHHNYLVPLVLISGAADFADGLVARVLGVQSALGKQLDSLADVISFGMVPGTILYVLLAGPNELSWSAIPAFVLTAFAAYRLGKFNIDERQNMGFIGLPTPACALFVLGYWLWIQEDAFGLGSIFSESYLLYGLIVILSWLMVAEIPMFSFKFKGLQWAGNQIKFIFAAIAIVAVIIMQELALAPLVLLYIILSIVWYWFTPKTSI